MDARHPSHAILTCFLCQIRTPLGCNDLDVAKGGRTHHNRKHTLPQGQIQERTTAFFAEEVALARRRRKVDRRMRESYCVLWRYMVPSLHMDGPSIVRSYSAMPTLRRKEPNGNK
eukprot:scaffold499_cov335-Pavlova_lutheri.AAC.47